MLNACKLYFLNSLSSYFLICLSGNLYFNNAKKSLVTPTGCAGRVLYDPYFLDILHVNPNEAGKTLIIHICQAEFLPFFLADVGEFLFVHYDKRSDTMVTIHESCILRASMTLLCMRIGNCVTRQATYNTY